MDARVTVLPRRLTEPGPSEDDKQRILEAASTAPDHRQILPWRLIEIPLGAREGLARVFEDDLMGRDPLCTAEERERAREKAHRSPWLLAAVCREQDSEPLVSLHERYVSLGCAIQNILLTATALGFHASLTTGQALRSAAMADFIGVQPHEAMACFISIGTAGSLPKPKTRPHVHQYFSTL